MGENEVRDHCGFFVAYSPHDVYKGLQAEQHRGREAAGIGVVRDNHVTAVKWLGNVSALKLQTIIQILGAERAVYLGHVRYATSGRKDPRKLLEDAHPHTIGGEVQIYPQDDSDNPTHMIITRARIAGVHNGTIYPGSMDSIDGCDFTDLQTGCDTEAFLRVYDKLGADETMKRIPSSFSIAIADAKMRGALVMRDRFGLMPAWLGEKDGYIIAASEDEAIRQIGGKPIREVDAGEIVHLKGQSFESRSTVPPNWRRCFFQINYVMHRDSHFGGRWVYNDRFNLGRQLAREFKPDVDFVTYIPECPEDLALGYSHESGIPLRKIFYKKNDERSFQGPTPDERRSSIKRNLHLIDGENVRDKRILIVDDSIIRANNSPHAINLARQSGAEYVALAVGTPMIGRNRKGCVFGVDMPDNDDFVAAECDGDLERISSRIGADDVYYISKEGQFQVLGPEENYCTRCIGGSDPVEEAGLIKPAGR